MYNNQYTNRMLEPKKLLISLGLSMAEVEVLHAIMQGAERAADIMKQTGLKRPTVYYCLQRLKQRGLVLAVGSGSRIAFRADLASLSHASDECVQEVNENHRHLTQWIQLMAAKTQKAQEKPAVVFYEGVTAVRRVIMETMYTRTKHIDSIAPTYNFFRELGEDMVEDYVSERNARGITTRSLWEGSISRDLLETFYGSKQHVRILPKQMEKRFSTTLFLYDDKALYISSLRNAYAVLMTSSEHHDFMTAIFDSLWDVAKPHPR